ncbi:MAG TPA: hypothetical protein VN682_20490 [Terriglobales bacterium]|nr:hypothetical protein [Terriglobales bacterium]
MIFQRWLLILLALVPLGLLAIIAICLAWPALTAWWLHGVPNWQDTESPPNVSALGEILLVAVLAIEGAIAFFALVNDQRGRRASANEAIMRLYEMYMTTDYHKSVRTIARYSLWKARGEKEYGDRLTTHLLGIQPDEQYMAAIDRERNNQQETPEDSELMIFHNEYHRVLDILSFFNSLSLLQKGADTEVLRICHFFYDSWRFSLHRIVTDLEKEVRMVDRENERAYVGQTRVKQFRKALKTLDRKFAFKPINHIHADTQFQN